MTKMRKALVLSFFLFMTSLLSVQAANCLVLQLRDGTTYTYVLEQQPRITFADNTLLVKSEQAETTASLPDVQDFHFADIDLGISPVLTEEVRFAFTGKQASIQGYKGLVILTDLQGRQLQAVHADKEHVASFDMAQFPQGTYLLCYGKQCIKLYNK